MQYLLEIHLHSATSPGSGEGWAGMIDSDITFDDLGLPYIPARRIRGILREMAEDIVHADQHTRFSKLSPPLTESDVKDVFGKRGQVMSSPLRIENAVLKDYDQMRDWVQWALNSTEGIVTRERVIQFFTHLRQQTAIDPKTETAQKGSLRSTRVLNSSLIFISRIDLTSNSERHECLLALASAVARNLGVKRNRGFGQVCCTLKDQNNGNVIERWLTSITGKKGGDNGE